MCPARRQRRAPCESGTTQPTALAVAEVEAAAEVVEEEVEAAAAEVEVAAEVVEVAEVAAE